MTLKKLMFEIEKGDVINGEAIVRGISQQIVITDHGTYNFRNNGTKNPLIKTVSRNGKTYFVRK